MGVAPFEWKATDGDTYKINLLDAPGYPDFVGEEMAALSVADLAILVVSAVDGIEVGTELAWERCVASNIPRLVFVNKDDKQRANFHNVLAALRSKWGHGFVPLELPLGEEEALHGIADVLSDQAFEYDRDGRHHTTPLPTDIADEEHRVHDELVEEIVSGDDDQLERYLSGDVPSAVELERTLAHEVLDRLEFPVLVGSALTGVGIDRLADFICEIGPGPADRPMSVVAGTEQIQVPADSTAQPLAYVFKTLADQFVGQVSLCKVVSGTISVDDRLISSVSSTEERLHGLFHMRGKEQLPCAKAVAGDIVAVAKLANTTTGTTLAPRNMPVKVIGQQPAAPVFGLALKPLTQTDDDKLSGALHRLVAEDPGLSVEPQPRSPNGAQRCRRHTSRRCPRTTGAQVRGARRDRRRSRAIPRDGGRHRRRRGQGQEAVRWPRAVRGCQLARQPVGAWLGIPVRRLDRRRRHPAQLHSGRRRKASRRQ